MRRKITPVLSSIEATRELVVSEIKTTKRSLRESKSRGLWVECLEDEASLNTYEFILDRIYNPEYVEEIFV